MFRIGFSLMALAVAAACSGRDTAGPTSPAAHSNASAERRVDASVSSESGRSGALHVTKECSAYTGLAGSFCTITSSNLEQIEVGSRVVYANAAGATSLDTDIILDPPGPGNNKAFGHCRLDFVSLVGRCTFSGGTGKFKWFVAGVDVSHLAGPNWAWHGTYSFSPHD